MIISAKIDEVKIELNKRKLESCRIDGYDDSMYVYESELLLYEVLGMEYDERHAKIIRYLEDFFDNHLLQQATVGPDRLYQKYRESYKENPSKITGNAVEGKLEGRSPI